MENVFYTEPRFRVYNRCRYAIGVTAVNGNQYNIQAGSFALLTAADIEYIESICQGRGFFSSGMLEVVDNAGKIVPLEKLNVVEAPPEEKVLKEDEIVAQLKKSAKQLEAWLNKIDDPVELHSIYEVAQTMDLPQSKLKLLKAKMPNKDWLKEFD